MSPYRAPLDRTTKVRAGVRSGLKVGLGFGLACALVAVGSTTAFAATLPGGPSVTQQTGQRPNATRVPFNITDQIQSNVDVGTGNLNVQVRLLQLPGVNGSTPLGVSYNSLDATGGSGVTSTMNAKSWAYSLAGAGSLSLQSNGSTIDFTAGDGAVWPFTAGTGGVYSAPAGLKATLTKNADGTFSLYYLTSATTVVFDGSDGTARSVTDRNGNKTTVDLSGGTSGTVTSTAGASTSNYAGTFGAKAASLSYAGSTLTISQSTDGGATTRRQVTVVKDANGYINSVTDAAGATTGFDYTGGLLTKITRPDGATTQFTYDASRRVTQVVQSNTTATGASTSRFAYVSSTETDFADADTSTSTAVSSAPHVTYTVSSSTQLVTKAVDQEGRTRSASYNGNLDTLTSTTGSGATGTTITNTYGANSGFSLTSTQAPGGATASASYANTALKTQYLPSSTKDDAANQTTFTYDGNGNMLTSQSPAVAAQAKVTRNSDGTIATAQAPGNASTNTTNYTYTNHQLATVTPPTGGSLGDRSLSYDSLGRLGSQTDGRGITTSYTYDDDDRLLTTAFSDSTPTVTNTYDTTGNLTKQVSGGGTITNTWDKLNQLITTVNSAGGDTETYGYDAAGHQTTLTDSRGTSTNAFDDSGVLLTTTYPKSLATAPNGGGSAVTAFLTDDHGRRTDTWLQAASISSSGVPAVWAAHYKTRYAANGHVSEVYAQNGPATNPSTVMDVYYCFNTAGSTTNCSTTSTSERSKLQWTYDTKTGQTTKYTYDGSGRLKGVAESGGSSGNDTFAYTYDKNGNRLTAVVTGTHPSSQTLTYNAQNQITTAGYSYDGAGNLTATPTAQYVYNGAQQMTSATVTTGGSGGSTNTFTYTYAGADQKAMLSQSGAGHAYLLTYGRSDPQGNPEIVGYNVDGVQAYVEDDPNTGQANMLHTSNDIACAYIYDGTGNPVALLTDFNTTSFTYKYDPYGVPTLTSGGGGHGDRENPYSFKAGVWDRFTGLVKFGLRWYDPTTGRWTQADTLDSPLDPTNANRYAFSADDPINGQDPKGLDLGDFICAGSVFPLFLIDLAKESGTGVLAGVACLYYLIYKEDPSYYADNPEALVATAGGY
jgi:RHS repeat-associated protein